MSEAELYVMKQRLVAAVRSKAERGELQFSLPPGYYWDEAGRIQKSPDEQIRTTLELIFARFEQFGTIHTAFLSLAEEGIERVQPAERAVKRLLATRNRRHWRRSTGTSVAVRAGCGIGQTPPTIRSGECCVIRAWLEHHRAPSASRSVPYGL